MKKEDDKSVPKRSSKEDDGRNISPLNTGNNTHSKKPNTRALFLGAVLIMLITASATFYMLTSQNKTKEVFSGKLTGKIYMSLDPNISYEKIFTEGTPSPEDIEASKIYEFDLQNRTLNELPFNDDEYHRMFPSVSPDGSKIAYVSVVTEKVLNERGSYQNLVEL